MENQTNNKMVYVSVGIIVIVLIVLVVWIWGGKNENTIKQTPESNIGISTTTDKIKPNPLKTHATSSPEENIYIKG